MSQLIELKNKSAVAGYGVGALHLNQDLNDVSIMFSQDPRYFTAMNAAPTIDVVKQSDNLPKFNRETGLLDEVEELENGAETSIVQMGFSRDSYFAKVYALGMPVTDYDRINEDEWIRLQDASVQETH